MQQTSELVRFIDRQLDSLLSAPDMWGSEEAVELQALLLVEVRAVALRPKLAEGEWLTTRYEKFLSEDGLGRPYLHLDGRSLKKIVFALRKFRAVVESETEEM